MSISITGIHFSITDAIQERVESKINRLAKRYPLISASINLSTVHDDFTCSITYKGDHNEAQGSAEDRDLYKAINLASERLERQLNDQKELYKKKGRESVRDMNDETVTNEVNMEVDEEVDEEVDHY